MYRLITLDIPDPDRPELKEAWVAEIVIQHVPKVITLRSVLSNEQYADASVRMLEYSRLNDLVERFQRTVLRDEKP